MPHGRMSPPPSYDEVVFNVQQTKRGQNDLYSASASKLNLWIKISFDSCNNRSKAQKGIKMTFHSTEFLIYIGRDHKVGSNGLNNEKPNTTANSSSSVKRDEGSSSSSGRNLTSLLSPSNEKDGRTRGNTVTKQRDIDEADCNHAPPQYSDAVRLPNIIESGSCTPSTLVASNSPTEESGVL